ncbi:hypothetical protein Taro_037918 [Colocasia esculenta]|uniref:Uncharacterized protein n=1 Tax=Colocasia esculenta TaxID=4460 RepID=A0A843WHN6_COLES|nr:hypothetical protein [Colocasia esculenta]
MRQHHRHHREGEEEPTDGRRPVLACCCNPCNLVASLFRRVGRCLFVACYPVLQCSGLDESRHHHHDHLHRHFS